MCKLPTRSTARPPHASQFALGPDMLLSLLGATAAMALIGLARWSNESGTALLLYAVLTFGALAAATAARLRRNREGIVIAGSFGSAALGLILLQGALSLPVATVAAAFIGVGLGGPLAALQAWRRLSARGSPAAFAVAALFVGQAGGALTWTGLAASPLSPGSALILLATLLGLAAFASPGLVESSKSAPEA